ncbi:MAG: hypothetical protein EXS31_04785 [Pedosphaera sp.]|nr:hypothetical protein [Pedosphaera sp.]
MTPYVLTAIAAFLAGCAIGSGLRNSGGEGAQLRRLERKLNLLLENLGVKELSALSPEVQELARDSRRKIAAIKLHREQTNCGLAEAKQAVEDFILSQQAKG